MENISITLLVIVGTIGLFAGLYLLFKKRNIKNTLKDKNMTVYYIIDNGNDNNCKNCNNNVAENAIYNKIKNAIWVNDTAENIAAEYGEVMPCGIKYDGRDLSAYEPDYRIEILNKMSDKPLKTKKYRLSEIISIYKY